MVHRGIYCFIVLFIFTFAPGIPPHVSFTSYEVDDELPREGGLAFNDKLNNVERIYEGHLHGPESILSVKPDELFVSVHTAEIVRIFGKNFENLQTIYTGGHCEKPWEEAKCGRPLGLRFSPDGKLLVADAYLGILEIDVSTGKREIIVNSSVPIDGITQKFVDDLDVDKEGNIYWSDASSNADINNALLELLGTPSGRFFKYNAKTKTTEVLLKDLHFANGVQLSPDQSFVLVNECCRKRVLRYWLKGPKTGTHDVFVSGLPGTPDNIRANPKGGYFVSLITTSARTRWTNRIFSKLPFCRRFLARVFALYRHALDAVNSVFPSDTLSLLSHKVFQMDSLAAATDDNSAMVVILDENGKVIDSLQGDNGRISLISETAVVGDYLFFGSPYNNYLGRLHVDSLKNRGGDDSATRNIHKEEL